MSLTTWRSFVVVCQTGSIGGAAQLLGYTQSALSRQVQALEKEAQATLLERLPRGVRPTRAGEVLLRHAAIVVDEASRGLLAARACGAEPLRLTVGSIPSAAAALVPATLKRLAAAGEAAFGRAVAWSVVPGLTADLVERVRRYELDCGVVTDAPPGLPATAGLVCHHVMDDEMVVIVAGDHRLAGQSAVDFADLRDELWAEDNSGSEALLRQLAARAGDRPRLDHTPGDLLSKAGLVAAGQAIALVPGLLIPALRADLRVLRMRHPVTRGIYLATMARRTGQEQAITAFREQLSQSGADQLS